MRHRGKFHSTVSKELKRGTCSLYHCYLLPSFINESFLSGCSHLEIERAAGSGISLCGALGCREHILRSHSSHKGYLV